MRSKMGSHGKPKGWPLFSWISLKSKGFAYVLNICQNLAGGIKMDPEMEAHSGLNPGLNEVPVQTSIVIRMDSKLEAGSLKWIRN